MIQQHLNTFSGRRASQLLFEIDGLIEFMRQNHCEKYLEIGARHGDTFHHVMTSLGKSTYGVAVDLPGGAWGTGVSVMALRKAIDDLTVAKQFTDVHMVLGSSHDADVVDTCAHHGPFDMVLIDGDHTYKAVSEDFRHFAPMTRFVAFHDITGDGQQTRHNGYTLQVEVPRLWAELKERFESWEFVEKNSLMGIGVLKVSQ